MFNSVDHPLVPERESNELAPRTKAAHRPAAETQHSQAEDARITQPTHLPFLFTAG